MCALPYCDRRALPYSAWCVDHYEHLPLTEPDDPFPLVECQRCMVGLHDCKGILDGCTCSCTRRRNCRCAPGGNSCVGGGVILDIALSIAAMDGVDNSGRAA